MFIALEGIDGSGKSTQTNFIVQWLETHGVATNNILVTREPTHDGAFGVKIRKVLSGEEAMSVSPLEFQELYVRDRKEHLENVIFPHLRDEDAIVICDRYFLSTLAYGRAGGVAHEDLMALHEKILGASWKMPDITFFIDVSAETAMARLGQRNKGRTPEYFETKKEFLRNAADAYRELAQTFSNVFVIDGEKPAEEVSQAIRSILISQFSPCTRQS
ncbi:dTMP kinase [Candidatus Azambacteria bacterium]|nr:dTMP kinase [Candidatus Azambacteria bacterium]